MSKTPSANLKKRPSGKAALALVPEDKPLSYLETKLAYEIAQGNSQWAAAVRAGYENTPALAKNIYAVVNKPNVQLAIAAERAKFAAGRQFTREKAFDMLQEAFDMGKLMAEPMAMVGAAREMIKMAGYNAPVKVELNVNGSVQIESMKKMSDTELLELINKPENAAAIQHAAVPMLEQSEQPEED